MAFDVSALGNYTRQQIEPLLTSAVFGAKTQELISRSGIVLTGVKSAAAIPLMDTDAFYQTDGCGWSPSGTTTFTQRTVTVGKIRVQEAFCPKDLETKFTQEALRAGANYESFGNDAFEAAFLEKKNARIAAQNEVALWQGDTGSSNANLNKFDGLIKLIDAGSPINANVSGFTGIPQVTGAITTSNVIPIIRGMKNAIPAPLKGMTDVTIFCGYDVYDMYVDAGVSANLFHYNFNDQSNYGGLTVPGTGIRLEAVHGLNGTGDLYAMRLANVAMGVDLESDIQAYNLWYSQDNDEVRFSVRWKMGVNVAFTNECVVFKGTI